jgi:hypothetical protein
MRQQGLLVFDIVVLVEPAILPFPIRAVVLLLFLEMMKYTTAILEPHDQNVHLDMGVMNLKHRRCAAVQTPCAEMELLIL